MSDIKTLHPTILGESLVCGLCHKPLQLLWLYSQPIALACPQHTPEWFDQEDEQDRAAGWAP